MGFIASVSLAFGIQLVATDGRHKQEVGGNEKVVSYFFPLLPSASIQQPDSG